MQKMKYIWVDGKMVPWDQAQVHVLTHALHYGSAIFEGIRAYACADGTIRADANWSAPTGYTTANSRKIGGFHYGLVAPGTTVAGGSFNTSSRQKKARITMRIEYRIK